MCYYLLHAYSILKRFNKDQPFHHINRNNNNDSSLSWAERLQVWFEKICWEWLYSIPYSIRQCMHFYEALSPSCFHLSWNVLRWHNKNTHISNIQWKIHPQHITSALNRCILCVPYGWCSYAKYFKLTVFFFVPSPPSQSCSGSFSFSLSLSTLRLIIFVLFYGLCVFVVFSLSLCIDRKFM